MKTEGNSLDSIYKITQFREPLCEKKLHKSLTMTKKKILLFSKWATQPLKRCAEVVVNKVHKVRFYSQLNVDEESHAAWMKSKQLLSSCDGRSISMTTELTPSADGRGARVLSCWGQPCVSVRVDLCYFRCTELKISLILEMKCLSRRHDVLGINVR